MATLQEIADRVHDMGAPAETNATPEPMSVKIAKRNRAKQLADVATSIERTEKAKALKGKLKKVAKGKKGKKAAPAKAPKAPTEPKAPKPKKPTKAERAARDLSEITATDVRLSTNVAPSVELTTQLQGAFEHFNKALFGDKLAPVMFSNVRLKKSLGHHWPASWARRKELKGKIDEIGLDFARLREANSGDKEVLSTLVHEMCHQLVAMTGKPERGHGHMWCAAMRLVGLEPVILNSKGEPTGKATGPNSSHTIDKGGAFDKAADELLGTGWRFVWFNEALPEPEKAKKKKKAGAKAKHTCPECGANAWGKPSMVLTCTGDQDARHDPVEMDCDRAEFGGDEGGDDNG